MSNHQAARVPEFELRPVQFSRLTRRGIMLGLSLPQLIVLSIGVCSVVGALYAGGGILLAWTAPIWVLSATLAWVPVGSRKLVEWIPITSRWLARAAARQRTFRRKLLKPRPASTLALPGDAAALREWHDPESGAAMIHDPHKHTLTAIVGVSHPAFVLLDPGEQDRRVSTWGRVLATMCRSGRVAQLQVLERTLPDGGSGLLEWWRSRGQDDGSWTSNVYRELIERAGPAGERHATTISLALDMRLAARQIRTNGGGIKGASAVLRQEMTTLTTALRAADLTITGWLTPDEVAVILRAAYDPASAAILERNDSIGRSLSTAGPVAVTETWDQLRSDSAHHAVLWISEWPRSQVFPGFLSPVLLSSGIQRAFTVLCTPIRSDAAARDIRKKKTELISDAAQRHKMGQIEDAAQTAEYGDVLQQEADLTAGHGVLRFTGLISVSAVTPEELDTAVAAIEQAAIQASCETRRLVGQQARAFTVAALPLCRTV